MGVRCCLNVGAYAAAAKTAGAARSGWLPPRGMRVAGVRQQLYC